MKAAILPGVEYRTRSAMSAALAAAISYGVPPRLLR
jgi:hypothetical protein